MNMMWKIIQLIEMLCIIPSLFQNLLSGIHPLITIPADTYFAILNHKVLSDFQKITVTQDHADSYIPIIISMMGFHVGNLFNVTVMFLQAIQDAVRLIAAYRKTKPIL